MPTMPIGWVGWALLSAMFAALTAILAKVGVTGISSDVATFVRTIVVACVLALIVVGTGQWSEISGLSPRTVLFLALSGLGTGASWLCYFRALQVGDASRVAPVDKLSVVFVALFATLFFGERLSPLNWAGVAMVAVGVIFIAAKAG
jgi:transporter family protein